MTTARTIQGTSVSPGLALGPVQVVRAAEHAVATWTVAGEEVEHEIQRLKKALESASEDLKRRQRLVSDQTSEADAQIFAVHRMILSDPGALAQVEATLRGDRINAESAVQALIRKLEASLGALEGDSVRHYAADLADPWREVLSALIRGERQQLQAGGPPVVLAAAELTPQVMTCLERSRLLGVITEAGGRFSHGAVLARSFGVPCVVGLPGLLNRLEQGLQVTVDGARGTVQLRPDEQDVQLFTERQDRFRAQLEALRQDAALPAETTDGSRLSIQVNVESVRDLDTFEPSHSDGVGLLRSEFLYMERPQFPSEEEQFRLYRRVLEQMDGLPVTLRTLDLGGDKRLPYFQTPQEANPALGWRGLRISLEWRDLMRVQLRAALRAASGRPLRILLPMVTAREEILAVHETFDEVRDSLLQQGYEVSGEVPVGIMVEVPSAVLCLEELIRHVDFVSVGTNDLIQYLLATDRDNAKVARLYDPHHPAVWKALALVAQTARAAGKPCSVCGDIADDPVVSILLMGLGYDAISVAPHFLPEIKHAVRRTSAARARALVEEVQGQPDCQGVRDVLERFRESLQAP